MIVVLVCMLIAQPEPGPEARLAEALEALDALEMEKAAALLEPLIATHGLTNDVRARAWLALGLTRASLLDTDGARAAFTAALAIDAHLELPAGTSPKVQELFDRTREALAVEVRPPVDLEVTAPPPPPPNVPPADAPRERMPWLVGGGALLAAGAVSAAVAFVAEDNLARPFAGRTRDDYEGMRDLGVGALATSTVLLAGGATVLVAALLLIEEPTVPGPSALEVAR